MTAVWSALLMLMGWLPGNMNAPQQPALSAAQALNVAPPACVSVSERLERDQRQALALERSA